MTLDSILKNLDPIISETLDRATRIFPLSKVPNYSTPTAPK